MAEVEELKLIVSLTDNASPALQRIRTDLQATQAAAVQNHERFRRQSAETERALKETIGAFQSVGRAVDFFTGRFGAAGVGVAAFGYLVQAQIRSIKEYAEIRTKLSNSAFLVGTSTASLKQFEHAFERVGLSAGQAQQALQSLQKLHADLLRPGSDIAQRLLAHAHTPEAVRNMQAYIAAMRQASTVEEQFAVQQRAAQQIYQDNLKYGQQFALDQAKAFLAAQGQSEDILLIHEKIIAKTQEQIRLQQRMDENAKEFNAKMVDAQTNANKLVDLFKAEAISPGSPLNVMLDKASAKLAEMVRQMEKAAQVEEEIPAPKGFWEKLNPFNPINVERERRVKELIGEKAPGGGTFAPFTPTLRDRVRTDYEPPQLQHGGIVTKPTLAMIGEGGPEAIIPLLGGHGGAGKTEEDQRQRDRLTDENNEQLKQLNQQLFELLHPPEGADRGAGLGGRGLGGGWRSWRRRSWGGGGGGGAGAAPGGGSSGGGGATGSYGGGDNTPRDTAGNPLAPKYGEAPESLSSTGGGAGLKSGVASPEVSSAIKEGAAAAGMDPAHFAAIAGIESSFEPGSNRNKATQYKGLFQIGRSEWARTGRGDIYNARDNALAAAKLMQEIARPSKTKSGASRQPPNFI